MARTSSLGTDVRYRLFSHAQTGDAFCPFRTLRDYLLGNGFGCYRFYIENSPNSTGSPNQAETRLL